jgi:signal transduction histidine kinase
LEPGKLEQSSARPGIDAMHLERIFEAFYTTKSSGVGMGLSICRSIIHAHGGRLSAEPNELRGAAFQLTLLSAISLRSTARWNGRRSIPSR